MPKTAAFDLRELRQVVAKVARLFRAPRRVVLRIEVQNNRTPGIVRQLVRLAVLIFQRKRRRFFPGSINAMVGLWALGSGLWGDESRDRRAVREKMEVRPDVSVKAL